VRILIAEDDPVSRRILEAMLVKWGYEVISTCNGHEAWQVLQSADAPRLAILDWMMPGLDGLSVCRQVRNREEETYTYIILLTALQRDEDIVTGLEAGADDYMTKPLKVNELRVRLRAGRRIVELQEYLIATREIVRAKADHDALTALWNHGKILNILSKELVRAQREGGCVGVIMADLDHFKSVNDTYGHMAGDSVLRTVAARLGAQVRAYDAIGRYGGEEFLIILPGCDRVNTLSLANRLCVSINSADIDTPDGLIPVTISLGVAASCRGMETEATALVRLADRGLYRAKENGRNRVEAIFEDAAAPE